MSTKSPLGASAPEVRQSRASGNRWFGFMVGMWIIFFVLMQTGKLDDVARWIRDLPLVLEILVWIVLLPWVLATAVWTSDWSQGLRVTLVVLFAAAWLLISIPRPTSRRR